MDIARRLLLGQRWLVRASLGLGVFAATGCAGTAPWKSGTTTMEVSAEAPAQPTQDTMILRAGHVEEAAAQESHSELAEAEDYFRQEKYRDAERMFHRIADNEKNPPLLAEKARYYEAECLRLQGHYPKAVNTYSRQLQDFNTGVYREQACARMFDIANYWLDDVREEMERQVAKDEGRDPGWKLPTIVNIDKTKPMFDIEGHAIKALELVHLHDITGPYADKALWLCGYVQFFRNNFAEADHYLSQLCDYHKDSKLRPQALELAIMAKNNSTGGALYDARKSSEALRLVHNARATCPELVRERGDFLDRQLLAINYQQAEKDYQIAEFYLRTKHPGSAYFYFDLVKRRYPGTKFAEAATEQLASLEELKQAAPTAPTPAPLNFLQQAQQEVQLLAGRELIIPKLQADAPTTKVPESTAQPGLQGTLTGGSSANPQGQDPNR
ncbi:tetratricopeptide repeat protein [Tuwongella immobilis]|uniref:Outer membrane lipoprotein BamD-like domain-containing protein n=1 Tax=Tuwongella immobilis TaxID=692036 RepID=A0A6C2YU99_9BACT|nr:tetratricopeptide repeat protein [Tuwongella immobilis]VIP04495.1 signal peptide protein : Uncharacterized protein OS=Planctomyces maris DSM 8797 GN=PM8797T_14224 PE=4 SV=1: TPR_16 [Tuwongella immobilis]VTS06352.1 signal peptide protein : Uncharacterized protein OS=Planctomyces maris DSM 8797 GN=PM8797T_14224 PE=4 SV=1: TPR_16 [Tuwongella immobilis]